MNEIYEDLNEQEKLITKITKKPETSRLSKKSIDNNEKK